MRALLTNQQVEILLSLNTNEVQFIPCWSDLGGIIIHDNEFDDEVFFVYKNMVESFSGLEWVEDEVGEI